MTSLRRVVDVDVDDDVDLLFPTLVRIDTGETQDSATDSMERIVNESCRR